jgi:carboxyl-terminal processing protease
MVSSSHSLAHRLRLAIIIVTCISQFSVTAVAAPLAHEGNHEYQQLDRFSDVLYLIKQNYVDPVAIDKLIEGAINGMLSELDPHSAYMTAEMLLELKNETKGQFSGIGIDITVRDHMITVIAPIADTPADRAGIKAGDKIIKIDGKFIKEMATLDAVNMMRGAPGTMITLAIIREPGNQQMQFTLTREIVNIDSIKQRNYPGGLGYIRIAEFQERTSKDLQTALAELNKKNGGQLKGLVLDLRNNPGGLLDQAVKVADLFLDAGDIVSTKGRSADDNRIYRAHKPSAAPEHNYPVVILINGGSASAAEIVAGALQDNSRAIILGTKTFGKGSVQSVIPLNDNSALRLTTARYYTPNGTSIQARGITPDIVAPQATWVSATDTSVREKDLDNHLQAVDNNEIDSGNNNPQTDYQLARALDLLTGWQQFAAKSFAQPHSKTEDLPK